MRSLIVIFLIIISPLLVFSQKKYNESISSALRILKVHHASLEKLSPFEEQGMENIERLNRKVKEQLLGVLTQQQSLILEKDTIPFFTCESNDKRFAVFNWEENLGGTFRQFLNVFYWKNSKGEPNAIFMTEEVAPFEVIYDVKNDQGQVFYLLLGSGISCNTCRFEKALLLQLNDSSLQEVFSFQIDYRLNNDIKGLSFDTKSNTLLYEFIEEDCEEEEGENCWVRGSFQFDGKTFVENPD